MGTLTDRDIAIRLASEDLVASRCLVSDFMTREVVSCQPSDDLATAELMKMFYSDIAAGKTHWQSLRSAIIALKEVQPHPYYWAPFIGIGAP